MGFKVIGGNVSPFVRKVRVALAEKGIDYELEPLNPFAAPEGFRDISPLGKIPVCEHDGRLVNDSSVFCAYLERVAPEPALYPADPYERARAEWLEEFMDGGAQPVMGSGVFFPVVLKPLMTGEEPDLDPPRVVFEEKLPRFFSYLEAQIGDREFLVGDRFGIADIAVASPFVNLRHAGFVPEADRFPALCGLLRRTHERASFAKCIEEEKPVFGKRWAEL
jgi:glutathione S-transferase